MSKLIAPLQLRYAKSLSELIDSYIADAVASRTMPAGTHPVRIVRNKRIKTRVRVDLSDDTFLVLHHDPRNLN